MKNLLVDESTIQEIPDLPEQILVSWDSELSGPHNGAP